MSKIAIFYPFNVFASHYALGGYVDCLRRMGHTVLDCRLPGNQIQDMVRVCKSLPEIDELNTCDVVISSFHEYVVPWLNAVYGFERWTTLKVPVIARFDESMDRMDLGLPQRLPELKQWAKYFSFPAAQDAEKYGGQWLPFGADTTIFKPDFHRFENHIGGARCIWCNTGIDGAGRECKPVPSRDGRFYQPWKKYDLGFIGSLYEKRQEYLFKLAPFLPDTVTFHHGTVLCQDVGGVLPHETTALLAENYRRFKVFFCLPPMSKLLVCKVFEVMACGTFVMYPRMPGGFSKNNIFKNNEHIVFYDPGYLKQNAKDIERFIQDDEAREKIARAGCELVHREYTLEKMFEKLLDLSQYPSSEKVIEFPVPAGTE